MLIVSAVTSCATSNILYFKNSFFVGKLQTIGSFQTSRRGEFIGQFVFTVQHSKNDENTPQSQTVLTQHYFSKTNRLNQLIYSSKT